MLTTGTVFFFGDMLSQQVVERKKENHEVERTVRSVGVGALYIAPLVTHLYNLVDKCFGPSQAPLNAVKKICLFSVFSPFTSGGFVVINSLLQRKSSDYITHQLREDVPTIVLTGYKIWIPTHFILLTLIPLQHRVLLSNTVGVMWTCYMTHAANTRLQPTNTSSDSLELGNTRSDGTQDDTSRCSDNTTTDTHEEA